MYRSAMCAVKGLIVGLVCGMVAGAVGCCYLQQNRRGVKRHIGHALRSMGELVDTVTGMF